MKRIFFYLIICFSLLTVQSCTDMDDKNGDMGLSENEVPPSVKAAFSAKYSTATDVKWENAQEDSIQTYKAKFKVDGKKMNAEFDATGNLVKEETD